MTRANIPPDSQLSIHYFRSKPRPYPGHKANLTRVSALLAHEGCGLAETSIQGEADVGRELASDFIAQPKPQFEVVETRARREFLDSLYGGVGLEAGLEDQSLRQR